MYCWSSSEAHPGVFTEKSEFIHLDVFFKFVFLIIVINLLNFNKPKKIQENPIYRLTLTLTNPRKYKEIVFTDLSDINKPKQIQEKKNKKKKKT